MQLFPLFLLLSLFSLKIYADNPTLYTVKVNPKYEKIITDLAYLQFFALGSIGIIALLPEDISQWSTEDKNLISIKSLLKKHSNNIQKAPVLDNDNYAINYIGHPIAGSYFYVWGRQRGLSWQESFMLTTLMSTFYWEYGWEAFAEVPSTQDLLITPILGSLLGEGTNYLYNKILYNDGKIYNSKFLGNIARGLLNPIGETNHFLQKAFHSANIEITVDYSYSESKKYHSLENTQSYFRLNFKLKY
ncbi:Ubiquitin-protein ligase [hydrothermal vent metagenome]|uniref:Ubiquitin-protein ligase n=1 Tax=hydrothermal vent metagenome TaxID=652676 RepID=A0A1W1D0F8_9ZZZZ